jgi:hypothetical protein
LPRLQHPKHIMISRPADAVPQMLWESSAFHLVPFHCKKRQCRRANTRSRPLGVADLCAGELLHGRTPGRADRIACEEQSALVLGPFELVVGLLLGVSLEFDEGDSSNGLS